MKCDDLDAVLANWRRATTPLDHKIVDQDAAVIASPTRYLSSLSSPRKMKPHLANGGLSSPTKHESKTCCHAWNHKDFLARVGTYSISTWFAKPTILSPLQCARFGWINTKSDLLTCQSCGQFVCCHIDPNLSEEGVNAVSMRFKEQLVTAHSDTCPWKANPSPESFTMLPIVSASQVIESVIQRTTELLSHSSLCQVLETFEIDNLFITEMLDCLNETKDEIQKMDTNQFQLYLHNQLKTDTIKCSNKVVLNAAIMSICGWNIYIPSLNKTDTHKTFLTCSYCNRHVDFHRFTRASTTADEETPAKRIKPSVPTLHPIKEHRSFCPWATAQERDPKEQERLSSLLSLVTDNKVTEEMRLFILLPGWKQSIKGLSYSKTSQQKQKPPRIQPEQALASVQSILSLPQY